MPWPGILCDQCHLQLKTVEYNHSLEAKTDMCASNKKILRNKEWGTIEHGDKLTLEMSLQ